MDKLLAYLNSLDVEARAAFAERCQTSVGYLRKAGSIGQRLSEGLCLRLSAESGGALAPEDLRPDVDWPYMRRALADNSQMKGVLT
jgi:DNA-binding transcriptional regulator YdaS (Cro superfamily)